MGLTCLGFKVLFGFHFSVPCRACFYFVLGRVVPCRACRAVPMSKPQRSSDALLASLALYSNWRPYSSGRCILICGSIPAVVVFQVAAIFQRPLHSNLRPYSSGRCISIDGGMPAAVVFTWRRYSSGRCILIGSRIPAAVVFQLAVVLQRPLYSNWRRYSSGRCIPISGGIPVAVVF